MELKPGYKQTEVGVIPEDWEVNKLEKDISLISGHHVLARYCNSNGEGLPYITGPADFPNGVIQHSKFTIKPTTMCRANDILLTVKGSGAGTLILSDTQYCISRQLMAIRTSNWNTRFIYYLLKQDESLFGSTATGLIPGLSRGDILNKTIITPSLAEQAAIANALSDVDALIQSLTRLIAKKRQIKQGAMQTLLNPYENGRLKAGWVVKKLGEITDLLTGFPFSSLGYTNEGIRLLRGSNIKRGQTDWNDEITKCWPSMTSDIRRYELLKGDIVVAMDGSLVGRSFAQLKQSDLPALLLQRVARIRSKSESFDINYIKEWVCSEIFTKHCDSLKTVTAIPHISPANIYNFVLNVPEQKEEQTRIATILSDMDAEIAALETKLAKYRQIKQGMMQNLLTGRIRLVKPESKTGAAA
ncbi:type I restriction enzyme, S subunit [Nitrosomonas nitrosa]|uniref:Type I restriction enzyme, S subunit n=1 Tax=Nitrosomonas nitrosa TaxID=52442 RepID=A0A1I4MFV2_9PROT|nr:restriction endonuclease subunit S [Nitrosomonas nitrosa]SFM02302.1 type I restriction enzyme, S subunit [Nitrosomonas nitrosa]